MAQSIVWFDIPTLDLDRAIRFYSAVLALRIEKDQLPEMALGVFPHSDDSIGGCLFQMTGERPAAGGPLLYFRCEGRLDQAIAAVESNGGKVLQAKHSIAPHGFRAVVQDSEGNRIALHSMK